MPTPTYDLLDSTTLGTASASVTFSSIPATYRDLILVSNASLATDDYIGIQLNSDTTSSYSTVRAYNTTSNTFSGIYARVATGDMTQDHLTIIHLFDYTALDKHKTFLTRDNSSGFVAMHACRWASTAAVNSVTFMNPASYNFVTGSTFYLFGIVS